MINPNPTELVSVDSGFCTTSLLLTKNLVQKPVNHRGKLGGGLFFSVNH
jgi:hypothetical protein